jgi:hypothetical protein
VQREIDGLRMKRREVETSLEGIVDNVPFVPGFYVRPWKYESTAGTRRMRALAVDEGPNLR